MGTNGPIREDAAEWEEHSGWMVNPNRLPGTSSPPPESATKRVYSASGSRHHSLSEQREAEPQKTLYVRDLNGFPTRGSVFAVSGGYWPPVFL